MFKVISIKSNEKMKGKKNLGTTFFFTKRMTYSKSDCNIFPLRSIDLHFLAQRWEYVNSNNRTIYYALSAG